MKLNNTKQWAILIGVVVVVGLVAGIVGSGINNTLTGEVIKDSQSGAGKNNSGNLVLEDTSTNTAWMITHRGSAAGDEAGDLAVYYQNKTGGWSEKFLLTKNGTIISQNSIEFPFSMNGASGKTQLSLMGFSQEFSEKERSMSIHLSGDDFIMKRKSSNENSVSSLDSNGLSIQDYQYSKFSFLGTDSIQFCKGNACMTCSPNFVTKTLKCS